MKRIEKPCRLVIIIRTVTSTDDHGSSFSDSEAAVPGEYERDNIIIILFLPATEIDLYQKAQCQSGVDKC